MGSYAFLILLVVMFGAFYLLLIRPQRKKQKEHQEFVDSLKKGDRVLTIGGLYGEVDSVGDQFVVLRVEGGGKLKFLKQSIMGRQPDQMEG